MCTEHADAEDRADYHDIFNARSESGLSAAFKRLSVRQAAKARKAGIKPTVKTMTNDELDDGLSTAPWR